VPATEENLGDLSAAKHEIAHLKVENFNFEKKQKSKAASVKTKKRCEPNERNHTL